jgi:hypothetical protein
MGFSSILVGGLFSAVAVVLNYLIWYLYARGVVASHVDHHVYLRYATDAAPAAALLGLAAGMYLAWRFFANCQRRVVRRI